MESMTTKIKNASVGFVREELCSPFGFKGAAVTSLRQVAVRLETESGNYGTGVGVFSTLWSDSEVFARFGEEQSNEYMLEITKKAVKLLCGRSLANPIDTITALIPELYDFAKKLTDTPELKKTFVLNALVPVDFALWQIYARSNHTEDFMELCEAFVGRAFSHRHSMLAGIPLITYGTSAAQVQELAENGVSIAKIKIGNDPNKNGSVSEMLAWDQARLAELHHILRKYNTPHTQNGKIAYYLDANGRYPDCETLHKFLQNAEEIGAKEHIVMLEEPFPEGSNFDVSEFSVPIAADESAHSVEDVANLISLGYSLITLKPIAKTLSISLLMLDYAYAHKIPCFTADLTVNPLMVDWNKSVAARLAPIPGMKIGILESNGAQNYKRWEEMCLQHPCASASWIHPDMGVYHLGEEFYKQNGGIFKECAYYTSLAGQC